MIATVTYRWDDQPGVTPGWYCESRDENGRTVDDSQKIWWPIDVDQFGEDERAELAQALRDAFPDAVVRAAR